MTWLALSCRQPWPWAIFYAGKLIENRGRALPAELLNKRCLIHASKTMTREEYETGAAAILEISGLSVPPAEELPLGALVGAVTFTGNVEPDPGSVRMHGWHVTDQWGWLMAARVPFPRPVPCLGERGFWAVPAEAIASVRAMAKAGDP